MTQLIINETEYPWTDGDRYVAYQEILGESKRSITGKLFTQVRGKYWVIEYSYDYMGDDLMRKCLADLGGAEPLRVEFLSPNADEHLFGLFKCSRLPRPSVAFDRAMAPVWHNIAFRIEEIEGGR